MHFGTADRLKPAIWVQAQVRLCDIAFLPIVVHRKGDPDAGSIVLKLNRLADGCQVYSQARTLDGDPAWMLGTGPEPVEEREADNLIARHVARDPDLWVVEIEDPKRVYELDAQII